MLEEKFEYRMCGAPNVKNNINVPIAKIGTTLHDGDKKFK